jgi:hypothetical protein
MPAHELIHHHYCFPTMAEHFILEVKLALVDVLQHYSYAIDGDREHTTRHQYDDVGEGAF